ncbi:uncharacterized protein TRIADDRAFT_55036 [Trichoplax adhaerens]|uniref:Cytochrome b561 domain-containing protein n=1 Tax=Trichoplax adhaerens TaxID=10228 RepID=B3RQM0_TRIAD|nr:hypothetical protein TRIADDRAFT_55036 [Trichoplax adhaerens]EDV26717.1 hypothetical protein TRIADDRAFT_55036 [Trichoplax adhaerens]|eukprot:XP_002110713.1 hypothetical protein TRIADDRAFT_55036 [Trichoplax adhaerens]
MPKSQFSLIPQRFQLHDAPNKDEFGEKFWPYLVIASQLTGILIVALLLIWLISDLGGFGWDGTAAQFNVHPLCMVLGMIFINGEAALSYRIFRNDRKVVIKAVHAILQAITFILIVIGLVAVWQFHNHNKFNNMYSFHSWCGLITVLLFSLQLTIGAVMFIFRITGERIRSYYLKLHVYFGCAIFVMAIATCLLGINEKLFLKYPHSYSNLPSGAAMGNCLGLAILTFGLIVIYMLSSPIYKRKPEPGNYSLSALGGEESEEDPIKDG